MKRILSLSLAVLLAVALSGCRNAEQEAATRKTVRFLAENAETRTAFAPPVNGVYETLWTANDSEVLLSLNYAKAEPSSVAVSADGRTASFSASFDASAASAPYTFYAVSPASAARAISPSRKAWSVAIAADQTPLATSVDEAAQLLVAKSSAAATLPDEVPLHFSHLTAYGRITLKNLDLGGASVFKAELVFSTPVVGEWYWGEDGSLTSNGASHTITLRTDASGDLWFACAPVSVGGTTMKLILYSNRGALSREIAFPEGRSFSSGKVAGFSVDMAGLSFSGVNTFKLVTDVAELSAGDEVLIVSQEESLALGALNSDAIWYRSPVAVEITDDQILDAGDATVLTLGEGSIPGTWSFHTGSGYLSTMSTGMNLAEVASLDDFSSWNVSISSGVADIVANEGESRNLLYYSLIHRFVCMKAASTYTRAVSLFKREEDGPAAEDPLMDFSEYGCYLPQAQRTYVKGEDQLLRSYSDGRLEFVLLNSVTKEQLVVSGFDPSLAKGGTAHVSVRYRRGYYTRLKGEYDLTVVKEDGPKVWLGDGTGQGIILKK